VSSYKRFAEVYDQLMTDIPYEEYAAWIMAYAPANDFPKLLDIGCGTGTMSMLLAQAGYAVSAVDLSEEMLAIAAERTQAMGLSIPFTAMSMSELQGFSDFDVAIIPIDSLNYVRETKDVVKTFEGVFAALKAGGQLFFDVHSTFKTDEIFMEGPFTFDEDGVNYVWHTDAGEAPHSVESAITFFVETESGLYERFDEQHYQRTYPAQQYFQWLQEAGFTQIEVTADFDHHDDLDEGERIFFRAVK
jgi:cyclopropane fatty-acyl-phospholipid synthase-like methyltransferase